MLNKRIYIAIAFIALAALVVSCAPHRKGWMFQGGDRGKIVHTAERYIGVKYKYGGATPSGFDCSGFTMYVYNKNGIDIPRSATAQFKSGTRINLRKARPGDLVFFHTSGSTVSHVGIYAGDYRFIHAPSSGKSVMYADIKSKYWRKRFIGSVTYI
jgi:cell wall-associated NlpC family hydrolase